MKKILFVMTLVASVFSLTLVSCGGGDDDSDNISTIETFYGPIISEAGDVRLAKGVSYYINSKVFGYYDSWSSSDVNVATVSSSGEIFTRNIGTTIITASGNRCNLKYTLTVVSPEEAYQYVDLGLPSGTLWAKYNLGAAVDETDLGAKFAWGETQGSYVRSYNIDSAFDYYYNNMKINFQLSNYKYYKYTEVSSTDANGFNTTITKQGYTKYVSKGYSSTGYDGFYDDKTVLDASDDAATQMLGEEWRMPSKAEWEELTNNCTWEYCEKDGVSGYKVTGKNSQYIFLPGSYYWSNELYGSEPYCLASNKIDASSRYNSGSIRAVRVKK